MGVSLLGLWSSVLAETRINLISHALIHALTSAVKEEDICVLMAILEKCNAVKSKTVLDRSKASVKEILPSIWVHAFQTHILRKLKTVFRSFLKIYGLSNDQSTIPKFH